MNTMQDEDDSALINYHWAKIGISYLPSPEILPRHIPPWSFNALET